MNKKSFHMIFTSVNALERTGKACHEQTAYLILPVNNYEE
jgi:hypothetical protein